MEPLSDWRGHVPALIAVCALLFTARIASLAYNDSTHPLFLPFWLVLDAALVLWAVLDERRKRRTK